MNMRKYGEFTTHIEGDMDFGVVILELPPDCIEAGPHSDKKFVTLPLSLIKEIFTDLLKERMIKNIDEMSTDDLINWVTVAPQ